MNLYVAPPKQHTRREIEERGGCIVYEPSWLYYEAEGTLGIEGARQVNVYDATGRCTHDLMRGEAVPEGMKPYVDMDQLRSWAAHQRSQRWQTDSHTGLDASPWVEA